MPSNHDVVQDYREHILNLSSQREIGLLYQICIQYILRKNNKKNVLQLLDLFLYISEWMYLLNDLEKHNLIGFIQKLLFHGKSATYIFFL